MKIRDALRISLKNIRVHRKRNLLVAVVMGVIFGLIFAIHLWFQGLENTYVDFAGRATDGKVIVRATNDQNEVAVEQEAILATRQEIIEDIETYGGEVISGAEELGMFGSVVLSEEIMAGAIEVDPAKVPEGYMPILASQLLGEQLLERTFSTDGRKLTQKQSDYSQYRDELIGKAFTDKTGAKYFVVGLTSGNFGVRNLSFKLLEKDNDNLLNPVLELVATPNGMPVIIDNGKRESWMVGKQQNDSLINRLDDLQQNTEVVFAAFPDDKSVYEYFRNGKGSFINVDFSGRTYAVSIVAGMSPEVQYLMRGIKIVIWGITIALGLVAAVVVIFTSIRLIDQDRKNIALYYSLGSTTGQIRAIYLCYFLELIIGAAVLAFGLASLLVLIFSFANQELLTIQAELGFNLVDIIGVVWYGINVDIFMVMMFMLLMAPVCIIVNEARLRRE